MTGILIGAINKRNKKLVAYILNQLYEFVDDLIIFDLNKSNKIQKMCPGIEAIKVNVEDCNNWEEIEDKLSDYLLDNNIERIFTLCLPILSTLNRFDQSTLSGFKKKRAEDNRYCFNVIMLKSALVRVLSMEIFSKLSINTYQIIIDPQEFSYNNAFEYNIHKSLFILNRDDMKYAPLYEHKMFEEVANAEKELDLFFIGTAFNKCREYIFDLEKYFSKFDSIFFKVVTSGKSKEMVAQDAYYERLSKARYTLIIPSYDTSSFSIIRLFEAINNNCVPLVLSTCCLEEVKATFPKIHKIILENLIVNTGDIKDRINNYDKDKKLIDKIKQTKEFRKITRYDSVKKYYNKLLGGNQNG